MAVPIKGGADLFLGFLHTFLLLSNSLGDYPRSLESKYNLNLPKFPGIDQIVELSSN